MTALSQFIQDINNDLWSPKKESLNHGTLFFTETPGVLTYQPETPLNQKKLAISCGIHGNETAPIEITWDILEKIRKNEIVPQMHSLFIFGHIPAMLEAKRFIDFNLNRLFSENYTKFPEARESARAKELEKEMYAFFGRPLKRDTPNDLYYHLDLHTAIRGSHHERFAVRPFFGENRIVTEEEYNLCASMGVEGILQITAPSSTFAGFSAEKLGATSFTVELGKVMPFGENDLSRFQMTHDTLVSFLTEAEVPKLSAETPLYYQVKKELIRDSEEYEFFIAHDYLNFSPLEVGQEIERNGDGILKAGENESIVFPNPNVPVGQRTGLLVKPLNK